jgi:hypothetical protein
MDLGDRLGHLTYSTLVHEADTWPELRRSLQRYLPAVKARVCPDRPFGVSIRLAAETVTRLTSDEAARAWLIGFLEDENLYVYTANAFPYGPFKGGEVMERVYEPDWATDERVRYTCRVADVLVAVTPPPIRPSIQSVPLAFRSNVTGPHYVDRLARNVLVVAAHLVGLERRTGRRVTLALEPEPACYLETTEETIGFFEDRLYSAAATRTVADLIGTGPAEAEAALRRHLGVVFDIGHQAVQFEDVSESLRALRRAEVPILKLQGAAALRMPDVDEEVVGELARFTKTIYLSQTTELRDGRIRRFLTLADAISAWQASPGGCREWRTHFHVPVFFEALGRLRTTRFAVEDALLMHRTQPLSEHLEIETYTWDVLPAAYRSADVVDYIVRELQFVVGELTEPTG